MMRAHLMKVLPSGTEAHFECAWEANVVRERQWTSRDGEVEVKKDKQNVMWSERAAQSHVSGIVRMLQGMGYAMVEQPLLDDGGR